MLRKMAKKTIEKKKIESLNELRVLEEELKEIGNIQNRIESKQHFTVGIAYGLFFGLLASFISTFIYEDLVKELPFLANFLVKILSLLAIVIFSILILIDYYRNKSNDKEFEELKIIFNNRKDSILNLK